MANQKDQERQQMAALLRRACDKVLKDWEGMVRARVRHDRYLSESLLRNSLDLLLENLANALADAEWSYHFDKNVEIALEHGKQRYDLRGHRFDQVVDEYTELRKAIIRNVAGDAHCTAEGVEVIHDFVDASIKHASGYFAALQHGAEKRALAEELVQAKGQRDGYAGERDSIRGYANDLERERQLRSEVISMLGHDMRTPLTASLLAAEMLARNPQGAQVPQKIERVIAGLQRLEAMLQNLLEADRLRTGQAHPIDVEFGDLGAIVSKAHRELKEVHGGRIEADIAEGIEGYWDSTAIQRLVENLINNAVKYGAADKPIRLKLERDGEQVALSVHNVGEPISAEAQRNLFTPHFRTDDAARSEKPGWGLGLALVKAVAEAHGGAASVESAASVGTTFRVRLATDCR